MGFSWAMLVSGRVVYKYIYISGVYTANGVIIYYQSHPLQEPEKSIDLALTQMGIQQISASVECKDNIR